METRSIKGTVGIECRADGKEQIIGYGAVFYRAGDPGTEYEMWQGVVERVDRAAFKNALARPDDVRGLVNHDPNLLLGRTLAGTMTLSVDDRGLKYVIDPPDTQAGSDAVKSIKRGDITGSSFSFVANAVEWKEANSTEPEVRIIKDVTLYDVGPVTFPAYESASTGLRGVAVGSTDDAKREYDAWLAVRYSQAIAVRRRLIDLDMAHETR